MHSVRLKAGPYVLPMTLADMGSIMAPSSLKHGPIDAPPSPTPGLSRVHQGEAKKALKAISCHLPQVTPSVHFGRDKPGSLFQPVVDFSRLHKLFGYLEVRPPYLTWPGHPSLITMLPNLFPSNRRVFVDYSS